VPIRSGTYLPAATDAPRQRVAADVLPVFPGWHVLAAHGLPPVAGRPDGALILHDRVVTAEDLVVSLPALSGWDPTRPRLVLLACVSHRLATRLREAYQQRHGVGLEVVAADGTVWQTPDGAITAGSSQLDAAGRVAPPTRSGPGGSGADRTGRGETAGSGTGRWLYLPAGTADAYPLGPDLLTAMGQLGVAPLALPAPRTPLDEGVRWAPKRRSRAAAAPAGPREVPRQFTVEGDGRAALLGQRLNLPHHAGQQLRWNLSGRDLVVYDQTGDRELHRQSLPDGVHARPTQTDGLGRLMVGSERRYPHLGRNVAVVIVTDATHHRLYHGVTGDFLERHWDVEAAAPLPETRVLSQ
jgi:hypothetical protein